MSSDSSRRLRPAFNAFARLVPLDEEARNRILDASAMDEGALSRLGREAFEASPTQRPEGLA